MNNVVNLKEYRYNMLLASFEQFRILLDILEQDPFLRILALIMLEGGEDPVRVKELENQYPGLIQAVELQKKLNELIIKYPIRRKHD